MTPAHNTCPPSSSTPAHTERLVIYRKSAPTDRNALYTMLEKTLNLYPALPGWEHIFGRGVDPLVASKSGDDV